VDDTLADHVLVPGLIDQHLHPVLGMLTPAVEVIAPEDWVLPDRTYKAAGSPEEYLKRLKGSESAYGKPGEWFFTWGYHPLWHGKIDKAALDKINPARPIAVWHRSCHEFYLNSAALRAIGLNKEATEGKGLAAEQSNWERGHFFEQGLNLILVPVFKKLATKERMVFGLEQLVAYLHQNE
jgi:predicted amidohydrolase YtcJ